MGCKTAMQYGTDQSLTDDVYFAEEVGNPSLHLFKVEVFFGKEGGRDSPTKLPPMLVMSAMP